MSQNKNSGAAANKWGRETARSIASKIGATMISKASNECNHNGCKAVIKCAKVATDSVGVTYKMLERLDYIIGAFQSENGTFELFQLSSSYFENDMRATASLGSASGKVGIVRKTTFESKGQNMGLITL
ncbi:hypothetical protein [Moritella yayanosii]|uniref:Uncharacterized protein n=1 Tax=Moritella yayanosii TaxID=69539 RepID=A0A330LIV8_9GAMM|nr:hypothetical protein [Moritella yayanosii]SQD76529.1 conserved protein of unknown function [Moritella yayanosii]